MRVGFGVLTVLLSLPATAPANPPATPDVRYVGLPEAEVRCQPSTNPQFYVTNRLHRGDAVDVVEELPDGWLKIRPPRGSFSWVNALLLQSITPNQPNYVYVPENQELPVYIGSEVQKGRPTVVGVKLKRGAQVTSIGKPLADDGNPKPGEEGPWMPIEAPEGEFRFIRADAVTRTKPAVDTVAAARVPNAAPAGSTFVPTAGPPPAGATQGNAITPVPDLQALYTRARAAQEANSLPEAITLYEQAATTARNQGQTDWAARVFAHANALRDRLAGAAPVARQGEAHSTKPPPADPTVRLSSPPGTTPGGGAPDYTAPGAATALTARGSPAGNLPSSGPGRLRRAGRTVEYQRTYVLEDAQGLPIVYAAPEPGLDLEPYINQNVELFGHAAYRGEIRAYYMTVSRVQPLP